MSKVLPVGLAIPYDERSIQTNDCEGAFSMLKAILGMEGRGMVNRSLPKDLQIGLSKFITSTSIKNSTDLSFATPTSKNSSYRRREKRANDLRQFTSAVFPNDTEFVNESTHQRKKQRLLGERSYVTSIRTYHKAKIPFVSPDRQEGKWINFRLRKQQAEQREKETTSSK